MSMEFVCSTCQTTIAKQSARRPVHCPGCGGAMVVPPPLPPSARQAAPFQWDRHSLLIVNGMAFTLVVTIAFFGTVVGYNLPRSAAMAAPPEAPPRTDNPGPAPSAAQTPTRGANRAAAADDKSKWKEFVDAGGRFRCQTPPDVTPRQIESSTRSKVGFDTDERKLGVIVANTIQTKIDQAALEELAAVLKRDSAKLGTLTVEKQALIQVHGTTAAEVVSTMKRGPIKAYARQIKFLQHGHSHVITTVTLGDNIDEVNRIFDQFIEKYRAIDAKAEPAAGKEKALPADLDFTPSKKK